MTDLRLNVGCGAVRIAGWVNIDNFQGNDVNPDIVADARELPFDDDSAVELYASHVLEHFDFDDPVLAEWHRVLKPGGVITEHSAETSRPSDISTVLPSSR